jgi:hypothetical protein
MHAGPFNQLRHASWPPRVSRTETILSAPEAALEPRLAQALAKETTLSAAAAISWVRVLAVVNARLRH